MISLLHQRKNEIRPTEEYSRTFGSGKDTPESLAKLFQGKADSFASGLPGVQTFWLFAFYGKDAEPGSRHPFIVGGAVDYGDLGVEEPDKRGRSMQEMRHLEGVTRLAYQAIADARSATLAAANVTSGIARELMVMAGNAMAENRALKEAIGEIAVTRRMEEADNSLKLAEYNRDTVHQETALKLLPAALGAFAPGLVPQGSQDTAMIDALFSSTPKDQIHALASHLGGAGGAMLIKRHEQYERETVEKEKAKETALEGIRKLPMKREVVK
jgi:hypothetical protein